MLDKSVNTKDSLAESYNQNDKILDSSSHHIKFNNLKLDEEMIQIEN